MKSGFLSAFFSLVLTLAIIGPAPCARAQGQDYRLSTVVIDPGHGGKDPGTVSPDRKSYEKTLVLKISKYLAEEIRNGCPDVKVILTRDRDEYIELGERARIATRNNANLFISIHINAAQDPRTKKINPKANGFSAYILGQSQKGYDSFGVNSSVVQRENSVIYMEEDYQTKYKDFNSDSPESKIMLQLMVNAFREQSLKFGEMICRESAKGPFTLEAGVRQDNFQVLRMASMPAVLVEAGFMTNPGDLAVLRNDENLKKIARNIFLAFKKYKDDYDHSMEIERETTPEPEPAPVVEPEPQPEPEPVVEPKPAPAEVKDTSALRPETAAMEKAGEPEEVYYGVQVLASSTLMFKTDPYFMGQEVRIEKVGALYKYIIGISDTPDGARNAQKQIAEKYPGAFAVSVKNHEIARL